MTFHNWALFAATVFLLSAIPGPNMLHALTRSVNVGFRRAIPAFAGCLLAVFCALVISAAGVGTVLAAMPRLFNIIRYAGAAYLLWLGIRAWMAPLSETEDGRQTPAASRPGSRSAGTLFRGGFLVGASNPKLLLFAAAFFPQFIVRQAPVLPQFILLIATFLVIESLWLMSYGAGGHRLARIIQTPRLQKLFNRVTGMIFLGFGGLLLKMRP